MRILTVFGTRPEAIKMAPVIRSAKEAGIETCVCVTAQHRGMLDQVMEVFGLKADFDLDLMEEDQSPVSVAARICETLGPVVVSARPDWLLVQGDTTTTFAAAFVGYHHHVRVGHIEAGLRTDNKWQPFPEEMNRRLVTALADLHFAPTKRAADSLDAEGVPASRIYVTGNTVVDALQEILKRPPAFTDPQLRALSGRIVLLTAHRRENQGEGLEQICLAAKDLVQKFPDITLVFPVHANPHVTAIVQRLLGGLPRTVLTDPLPYPDFVHLMKSATLILSDSGGVQEEAPTLGTSVLVLRDVTERPEAVESGWAKVIGTKRSTIVEHASASLENNRRTHPVAGENPFGDGHASVRIIQALRKWQP
jgi:UDP-N-acetylglucosamine 2-epimerase (non-hydrolysing)